MDEDTEEEDNESTDEEEEEASTWRRKGKAKAKMSKPKPKPKPKKQAAPRACGGKGEVDGADQELGLERVSDEATGEAGDSVKTGPSKSAPGGEAGLSPSPSPEAISIHLCTIAELEANLPQFSGKAYGIMDEMNPVLDLEIEALKRSDTPNMARYIELILDRASRQADVLEEMDPVPSEAISELDERGKVLYFLFQQFERQREAAEDVEQENPSVAGSENVGDDGDVNMGVADETSE